MNVTTRTQLQDYIAECTYTETEYSLGIDSSVEVFDKERFARLIVQKCVEEIQMSVSLKYADSDRPATLAEEWVAGHYAGSIESRVAILQKFGI